MALGNLTGIVLKLHFNLAKERVVYDFSLNGERPPFVPDGMTIDQAGCIYVATFGGSTVYKIDPRLVF